MNIALRIISLLGVAWLLHVTTVFAQNSVEEASPTISKSAVPVEASVALDALLQDLTRVSLRKMEPLIQALEKAGGDSLLPLFETLQDGRLYYQQSDLTLIDVTKNPDGEYIAKDVYSKKVLGPVDKKTIKKIRVNNKLRGIISDTMARLELNAASASVRLAAVKTMTGELNDKTAGLLQARWEKEKDSDVKAVLEQALALYRLRNSDDVEVKITAINLLAHNLDPQVRHELQSLAEKNADGDYIEKSRDVRKAAVAAVATLDSKISFYHFVEQLFFGLSLGSILLLAAIGLSITFGVMGVINMAHGEMIMLGAYTTYVVQLIMPNYIEYSIFVAIPAAFLVSGLVGVLIERGVIQFLQGRPLETLLATFGISLILQQAVRTVFSPLNRQVATPEWMSGSLEINPLLSLTYNRLYIFVFALLVFFILQLILKKTSLGLNVRAVSQNRNMAKAMGIRTEWVDAMTFGLGSGIAGVAGVALSQLTNVGPNLGQSYIIDSFMVVVFGGVGNLLGTLVGGFSLGIVNKFLEPGLGPVLANICILVAIILFIQKRPKGLFPQKGRAAND